jgi:hypothetical protein
MPDEVTGPGARWEESPAIRWIRAISYVAVLADLIFGAVWRGRPTTSLLIPLGLIIGWSQYSTG